MRESLERNMFIIEEEKEMDSRTHKQEVESNRIEFTKENEIQNKLIENLATNGLNNINNRNSISEHSQKNADFLNPNKENNNWDNINRIRRIDIMTESISISPRQSIKEGQSPSNVNKKNERLFNINIEKSNQNFESTTAISESDQNRFETFDPNQSPPASKVLGTLIHNAKSINRFSCMYNQSFNALNYNFLFLKNTEIIKELIQKNKEKYEENDEVFNYYVYQISGKVEKIKKEKTIIIINSISIYFLHKEKYKVIQKIPIDSITSIILLRNSPYLLILKIENESDLFIEIIHRIEFIVFLSQNYRKRNGVKLPVQSSSKIKKFVDGQEVNDFNEDDIKGISKKTTKLEFYNNAFENALKSGYLQKNHLTKTFFFGNEKSEWINKFYVLTNIGIIGFESPNSDPSELIPLNEASKINIEATKIKIINSIKTVVLQANSMFEANSWLKMLNHFIKKIKTSPKNIL